MAKTPLHADLSAFLQLFIAEGVEFLLIGGHAVVAHGYLRTTGDLDVWVRISDENARRIVEALYKFGFARGSLSPALFLKPGAINRMGVPPYRIEILNQIAGVEFDACYGRRVRGQIGGIEVPMISLNDLLQNKRSAGRLKDLADVEELTPPVSSKKTARPRKPKRRNR